MAATRSVVATYFDNATPAMIKFEDVEYNLDNYERRNYIYG